MNILKVNSNSPPGAKKHTRRKRCSSLPESKNDFASISEEMIPISIMETRVAQITRELDQEKSRSNRLQSGVGTLDNRLLSIINSFNNNKCTSVVFNCLHNSTEKSVYSIRAKMKNRQLIIDYHSVPRPLNKVRFEPTGNRL